MNTFRSKRYLVPLLTTICVAGCGGHGTEDYVQSPESARAALEVSLDAWRNGQAHGTIQAGDKQINVFDSRWRDGEKIDSFSIIEELPGDPHPEFRVSMRRSGELADEICTYLVMGIDPILVFRAEDYQAATGM